MNRNYRENIYKKIIKDNNTLYIDNILEELKFHFEKLADLFIKYTSAIRFSEEKLKMLEMSNPDDYIKEIIIHTERIKTLTEEINSGIENGKNTTLMTWNVNYFNSELDDIFGTYTYLVEKSSKIKFTEDVKTNLTEMDNAVVALDSAINMYNESHKMKIQTWKETDTKYYDAMLQISKKHLC